MSDTPTCPTCGRKQRPDPQHITLLDTLSGLCICRPENPETCPVHNRYGCDECFAAKIYTTPKTVMGILFAMTKRFRERNKPGPREN